MKTRLTLGEKLKDLRNEHNSKQTLSEVYEATGISMSTLHRMESDDEARFGYQDVLLLAKYYGVSTDYLFGLTDNRFYRNVEIDKLQLFDTAIEVLMRDNINSRLISELISHEDFPQLLNAMEIYIERKVAPQMNNTNLMYQYAEQTVRERCDVPENDKTMAWLEELVVDEDEYLRYKISERFNLVIKSLFDKYESEALPLEQAPEIITYMKKFIQTYLDASDSENPKESANAKGIFLCGVLGVSTSKFSDNEWDVLNKILDNSELLKRLNERKQI